MAPRTNQHRHTKPENIIIFVPPNTFHDRSSQIVFYVDLIDICESNTRNYSDFKSASMITA